MLRAFFSGLAVQRIIRLYVGEDTGDHTNRWNSFYARNDLKEILVDDPLSGNTVSLAAWRQRLKNEASTQ